MGRLAFHGAIKRLGKAWGEAFLVVILVTLFLPPPGLKQVRAEPPQYYVSIDTVNGYPAGSLPPLVASPVMLTGSFSATNAAGHEDQYGIRIDWGDGTNTIWRWTDPNNAYPYLSWTPLDGGAKNFDGTYNTNPDGAPGMAHSYASGGTYTITVRFFHQREPGSESADADVLITVHVTVPAISITKSGPDYAHEGDTVTYIYEVSNSGECSLSEVSVADDLGVVVNYISGDENSNNLLDLAETWIFSATYTVPTPSEDITNLANTTGKAFGKTVSDNASWTIDVLHPKIEVEKSADKTVAYEGDTITYTIEVTNTGDCTLFDVGLDDTLLGTIWTGVLNVGESRSFTLTYVVKTGDPDPLVNTVTASGKDVLGLEVADHASAQVDIVKKYRLTVHTTGLGTHIVKMYDGSNILGTATDAAPFEGWFDEGSEINLDVDSPVTDGLTRFVFTQWSGDSTGTARPIIIIMDSNKSVTANYKTQYYLTTSTNYGTVSPSSGWHDAGSLVEVTATAPSAVDGERYVWSGWTGTGTGSYTGTANPSSITMNSPISEAASWVHQYYLTVTSPYGATGGEGWYDEGSTAYATVTPLTVDGPAGVQYVFSHWSGDASGTASPSDPITMNAPKTAVANWKTKYRVTFNQTGIDETAVGTVITVDGSLKTHGDLPFDMWVDDGDLVIYTYEPTVSSSTTDKRFRLNSVTGPVSPMIVTGPLTVNGNYVVQYSVTFAQTGLDNTATGTVVTIGSVTKTKADLPFTDWFDSGTTYSYSNTVSSIFAGRRFRLDGVTGPASPITAPGIVLGNYIPQYTVTFTHSGLDGTATGSVAIVAGISKTYVELPFTTDWLDHGSSLSFAYSDPVSSSVSGKRFTLTSVSHTSPLIVTEPTIITGSYKTQYYLTVNTNPAEVLTLNPAAVSGGGWYDDGDTATVDAVQNVDKAHGQSRYDFRSWTGASPTGEGNKAAIIMDAPKTATANYQLQYNITFQQAGVGADFTGAILAVDGVDYDPSGLPASFWWDEGSTHAFSFNSPLPVNGGKRYVWVSTTGLSSAQSDSAFEVEGYGSIVGNYVAQYYITVVSAHNSPTASSWVDEGSDFTASVTSPTEIMVNDHQWVCTGFSVDEGAVQEGTSHTFTNVQAPHTIVFYWKQQFWIQVNSAHGSPTPSQWVDQGGSLTVGVTSPADESEGARYRCTGYTLDGNPPVEDGSTSHVFTDVQSAHTITFNWITQYRVTFYTSPAYGSITAWGVVKNNGESEFYDEGASVPVASNAPAGYLFSSWTVTGGVTVDDYANPATVMNVDGAGSLTANFVSSTVSITITSSPATGTGFIRVDGASYATPVTFTWVVGSTHALEAFSTVSGPTGTRYVWIGWSDGGARTHVYTVPGWPETVTAYFSVQYYLAVVSPYDTPGGSGWYGEGSTAYATLETGSVVEGGVRYVFKGWGGDASGTGLRSNPIVMNRPKTAIANWEAELYTVTFDKNPRQGVITVDGTVYTSLPVVLHWVPGSSHDVVVPEIEEEPGGTRYVFRVWSDGSTLTSRTITAATPGAVYTAYYDVQYRLAVHSEHGVTTGSGWYDEGVEAVFSVSPTVVRDESEGIEYTFKRWVGSGAGTCYTGPDNPAKVMMTGPIEEFAQWEPTMYYLNVVSDYGDPYGSGWYPPNSEASFGVNTPVNHGNRTLRVFLNWSGDISLREPAGTLLMVKPYTVTASWDTQYLVVYNTTAPNGVLLSIPRVPQTLPPGFNVFATYYSAGSRVEVGPAPEIVHGAEGVRYRFEGWAINGRPVASDVNLAFTVNRPLNISMIYGTEVLLTVNLAGVSQPYTVKLTVERSPAYVFDITPETPFKEWVRKDASVTLTVSSPNKIGRGEWAVFREWSGDAQEVQRTVSLKASSPLTVNAVFYAVNPVAKSIPYSLIAGVASTVFSRLIRRRRGEEHEEHRHYSLSLGFMSLTAVLTVAATVSSIIAMGYGINAGELPDVSNWAVVFTAIEAGVFLAATLLATRLAYPRMMDIPAIYPNPYGI